jgi:tetratricopeptide (TPR) repeat protein
MIKYKNMFKYFYGSLALLVCAVFLMPGCNKSGDKEQTRKDSLQQITKVNPGDMPQNNLPENFIKDSTDIYGTGNFNYRDSLDSFHRGYSIPRDSIYKVWNTKAFQELELQIKKHPTKPGPYLDRGNHFQNIKMYPQAIADYNLYIGLYSRNPSAYMNRGNAHERLKHYDSAMYDYQKVLELKPDDTIANFNKGNIYDILGKYDIAVKEYDTVIVKDPRLAKAYYNRGASKLASKDYAGAVADWEYAIRLNPPYEPDLRPRINKIKPLVK